jgi:catechol 2,3-dioxygenase
MSTPPTRLPEDARIGAVSLNVADLEGAAAFYERALGLTPLERGAGLVRLGAGSEPLVELVSSPDAPARPAGTTGLFHLAVLVPDRPSLADSLRRVAAADWRFTGASDHLVSEALYLRDPEGNGIEIYRDRPRSEWPYSDGQLQMDSLALDLADLLTEEQGAGGVPEGTIIGHVHLNVADLDASERFYAGPAGFDVTVRGYPGALFVAAGDYHHHIGLNTWAGEGAPAPPPDALGLRHFELVVPDAAAVDRAAAALAESGPEPTEGGVLVGDPAGNQMLVRAA